MTSDKKWVFSFDEIQAAETAAGPGREALRGLLGGKGCNLAEMMRIDVPVPPGFTLSTVACNAYLAEQEKFPEGLWDQVLSALEAVERKTGKHFGDAKRPLLVSCRSGAKFSMPGMMDTVLNIGLNADVAEGMIRLTGDPRFVYDSFRRLIQMFGSVVLGVRDEPFEDVLAQERERRGVTDDKDLSAEDLKSVVSSFKGIIARYARIEFPSDPYEQLRLATEAVFKSWNGKRAIDYRNAAKIQHDLGTAVNIQTMVFGNMGDDSATGVAMTRNAASGEPVLEGDYLTNAQGEDVVAGIRNTKPIAQLQEEMPGLYTEFETIAKRLERHYREMQDMEFTIEGGKLWLLQTRDGKRTAQAAVRIAVDMHEEGVISKEEAVLRVSPEQIEFFLHPQFTMAAKKEARLAGNELAKGLDVSPGAATGFVAFDADLAQRWATTQEKQVVMVRPETKPDDVHGMLAANGILTSRGGRTSHAALVARQFGKPAVVGVSELQIDLGARTMTVGDKVVHEGEWISIDGNTGEVFLGQLDTMVPDLQDPALMKLLGWADEFRKLGVRANADYPHDAERAKTYGAEGIGLCRTEHMFFDPERLPIVQKMITADTKAERREALAALLPFQLEDFAGLFRVMDGLPVIIRLIDPPLHEFLPSHDELNRQLTDSKIQLQHARELKDLDEILQRIQADQQMLDRVEALRESNPMLGLRGVRLGIKLPELTKMQVRAIFEAAVMVAKEGVNVKPEVMIPLTCHANELARQREVLEAEAKAVLDAHDVELEYMFGTMIEVPRAAITADQLAAHAQFLSFGTNDLTQTTFALSRDDAEPSFLVDYLEQGILPDNPFATIDPDGVGELMRIAIEKGRSARPDIEIGICGEHGGEPRSIALCHGLGLDYVSCSPFRVPVARLAAAQAAIRVAKEERPIKKGA